MMQQEIVIPFDELAEAFITDHVQDYGCRRLYHSCGKDVGVKNLIQYPQGTFQNYHQGVY